MSFKVGQEVIVKKALNGAVYYLGGSLKDVPLGSKGKVQDMLADGTMGIRLDNPRLGIQGYWKVHLDELTLIPREEKADSVLETQLLAEVPKEPKDNQEREDNKDDGNTIYRTRNTFIEEFRKLFFVGKSKVPKIPAFTPRFNPREEFAVWIRDQFPELEQYASKGTYYLKLVDHQYEVSRAAIEACEHGAATTRSCIKSRFNEYLKCFKRGKGNFTNNVNGLTELIENVSANLKQKSGSWHYGTTLVRGVK